MTGPLEPSSILKGIEVITSGPGRKTGGTVRHLPVAILIVDIPSSVLIIRLDPPISLSFVSLGYPYLLQLMNDIFVINEFLCLKEFRWKEYEESRQKGFCPLLWCRQDRV